MITKTIPQITMMKLEEMTPEAARVLIAQDVLDLLKQYAINPRQGCYVDCALPDWEQTTPLHVVLNAWLDGYNDCAVCALGAALVATVRRFDDVTIEPWVSTNVSLRGGRSHLVEYLERFFSKEQLALIEIAFEGTSNIRGITYPEVEIRVATHFGRHLSPFQCAVAIFQNIVANNGTFVLPS